MTLASSIISDALRETNTVAPGVTITSTEETEALDRLNAIIRTVLGVQIGYDLENWRITSATSITDPTNTALTASEASAWVVPPNVRLLAVLTAATSLTLDPAPEDGARVTVIDVGGNFASNNLTLDGNGATIGGSSTLVFSTNGEAREFYYRSDLGDWQEITALATSDALPFDEKYDDWFVIRLAARLNPRYGRAMKEESLARMAELENDMIARYRQTRLASPLGVAE